MVLILGQRASGMVGCSASCLLDSYPAAFITNRARVVCIVLVPIQTLSINVNDYLEKPIHEVAILSV